MCQKIVEINDEINDSSFFFFFLRSKARLQYSNLNLFEIIISLPNAFTNNAFLLNSQEKGYTFILGGIITQSLEDDQEFYISDYNVEKNNDLWLKLNSSGLDNQFTWINMCKYILTNQQIPIVLLYVRFKNFLQNNYILKFH